ncbi:MAG TPA: glycosyltransferase family 4 protein [Candidatus Dormibacteraeota bacterium]|nr:glycosyltransferase family 4 protein [Candidatus Dormibacteraeota bacterium]
MTIAHVDAERGFSGGEVQVFLLMEGLARRGHRNRLLCPPGSAAAAEAARRGIATATVPMRGDLDLAAVWRLAGVMRGADVVHLHTGRAAWLGGLAARRAALPAIVTRRMDRPVRPGWRTRLIYERCSRRTAAIAPGIVEQLVAGGVPRQRIVLIPSAVDPRRVQPRLSAAAVRAARGVGADEVVLLSIAALVRRKGIDVLLEALAALARRGLRPRLWVAGDGPERAALAAQGERHGVAAQVDWLGQRDDVGDLLAAADVFVLPSRAEGLGVAALEAMAAGRPVVASAVGGLAESVIEGRSGLLVPPGDAVALGAALERLLHEPALRAALGGAGPARVGEGFLAQQMVEAYERLYRDVLGP